jgi:excisionase family DNA binding protein
VAAVTLDVRGACEYLGIGRATLYRLVKARALPKTKLAGCTRFKVRELDRLLERSTRYAGRPPGAG